MNPEKLPYKNTQVSWSKSQEQIIKLMVKAGIEDVRFTLMRSRHELICEFTRPTEHNGKTFPIGVRIVIPDVNEKNENRLHRVLFWYLKSKLEILEADFIEFLEEFFPHVVIFDKEGMTRTIYEMLAPKYKELMSEGKAPQLMLPETTQRRIRV